MARRVRTIKGPPFRSGRIADFQTKYGYSKTGITLTRVERQIGGGRIRRSLRAPDGLGPLRFNPFDKLEFLGDGASEPQITDCARVTEYLAGVGLRRLAALFRKQTLGRSRKPNLQSVSTIPAGRGWYYGRAALRALPELCRAAAGGIGIWNGARKSIQF